MKLYIPELEDYWYEKKLNEDPETMSYNAGFDVSYDRYDYDTGIILFPESKFEQKYLSRKDKDNFFAYLVVDDEFVGYCNYRTIDGKTSCGVLIEASKRGLGYALKGLKLLIDEACKNGVTELYDDFEEGRIGTKVFFDLGFVKVGEYMCKKFGKEVKIIEIRKVL